MSDLIPKHGGYRKLKGFQVAQLCYNLTVRKTKAASPNGCTRCAPPSGEIRHEQTNQLPAALHYHPGSQIASGLCRRDDPTAAQRKKKGVASLLDSCSFKTSCVVQKCGI
jgi:hypothetical protein